MVQSGHRGSLLSGPNLLWTTPCGPILDENTHPGRKRSTIGHRPDPAHVTDLSVDLARCADHHSRCAPSAGPRDAFTERAHVVPVRNALACPRAARGPRWRARRGRTTGRCNGLCHETHAPDPCGNRCDAGRSRWNRLRRRDQSCTLQPMTGTEGFSSSPDERGLRTKHSPELSGAASGAPQECFGCGAPLTRPSAQPAVHCVAVVRLLASTTNELYRLCTGFPAARTSVIRLGIILAGVSA